MFKLWLENNRPIVSFDFDGVLHSSVIDTHPIDRYNWRTWEPKLNIHNLLKKEALNNIIVVVTARHPDSKNQIEDFLDYYDLPVEKIYFTSNGPKWSTLQKLGAIRHYDDNPKIQQELKDKPIEFIFIPS